MNKIVCSLLLGAFSLVTLSANEIRNGEFIGGIKAWMIQRDGKPTVAAKDADSYYTFEDGGVILDVPSLLPEAEKPGSVVFTQYLPDLKEGVEYTLTFECKVPAGMKMLYGLGAVVEHGENKGNLTGGIPLTEVIGSGEWETITQTFVYGSVLMQNQTEPTRLQNPAIQFRIGLLPQFGIRNVVLQSN